MQRAAEAEHDRVWGSPGSATRAAHDPAALVAAMPRSGRLPRFHLAVGNDDFPRMIAASDTMAALLGDAGIPVTLDRAAGDHTWDYAAQALPGLVARWRTAAA